MPGKVNERAIQVMAEAGVDISHHYSKHLDELQGLEFDYVVTVCDHVHEVCPVFPGRAKMIHRSFEDPSFMIGTEEEILTEFRRIRDAIRDFIAAMPENLLSA